MSRPIRHVFALCAVLTLPITALAVDIVKALSASTVLAENASFAVWRTPTQILSRDFVRFTA